MDTTLLCLALMSFHSTWAALLHADKVITNDVLKGNDQTMSTLRRYAPNDEAISSLQGMKVKSPLASKVPGPNGPRQSGVSGFSADRHRPTKITSDKSAGNPAFMVYKTREQIGNISDILMFDSVTSNVGNNFDVSTGIFTCSTPGMYVFSFTIITQDYPIINLVKNEDIIATIFRSYDGAGLYDTLGNQAVIQLEKGDRVGIVFMGYDMQSVYGDPYYKYTTFSGFQLF